MNVSFWSAVPDDDGEHLGTWYTDTDANVPKFPQVPREGEIVWLETKEIKLGRFRVHHVEWSFKNRAILNEIPIASVGCEVYVEPADRREPQLHTPENK
jgi:hypothetical protein